CEDMAALFFDADGDGDLDLFIASGGVEAPPGHPIYTDRLFLNNGKGYFTKSEGAIPGEPVSSGAACAVDFDQDGDIDLFVGGRVVPGQYPTAPGNRLLRNDGSGRFEDATPTLAPDLRNTGMVTGALWSDADGDAWQDLLITHEWGTVSLFLNSRGKLADAGLGDLTGWWNGITGGDFDNDGDIDYAVTNFGLNTKYHASTEKPALLYYGDLDGSGKKRIIEAEFEGAVCYPIRGKSCSTHAIPSLAEKFTSYKDFAMAKLGDIYPTEQLDAAQKFEASELRSGVLTNDGTGNFEFKPLPRLAQIAPGFGIVPGDFDGDGNTDLAMAQNFFSPQPETGRMDGGLSLLLSGSRDGTFLPCPPSRSGIVVSGDASALTTADHDGDGAPDLHFAINSEPVRSFSSTAGKTLAVRLPALPGTRVSLGEQSAELYAGSGYLSQSAPVMFFGRPTTSTTIRVRWPDGEITTHAVVAGATNITISR
ncbi:MAG: CRTAC1 family protein, partial [Verrucomicrobiales bacterium]